MYSPEWRTDSHAAWATAIGLVRVPLFSESRAQSEEGSHSVLLDGEQGSFVLSQADIDDQAQLEQIQSWAWSANTNFTFVVRPHTRQVCMLRWDKRGVVYRLQVESEADARNAFERALSVGRPKAQPAVKRVLSVFRSLRRALVARADSNDILRVFNAFLLGADAVREQRITAHDWRNCGSLRNMFGMLAANHIVDANAVVSIDEPKSFLPGEFVDAFVERDPATGCIMDANVLLRHASGLLYQEAHIELERPISVQGRLFGIPEGTPERQPPKPDARFTPPSLARMLSQQAIGLYMKLNESPAGITVLDPACGSGIFLREAFRELRAKEFTGNIHLKGYDTSPVAREMARFCISNTVDTDLVSTSIDDRNSIAERDAWGDPDVIMMNPPFAAWNDLDEVEREYVKASLGTAFQDHADKAIAFVRLAVQSLKPGAVLASVVPAPLLESRNAYKWRKEVDDDSTLRLHLVGCFRGFDYFKDAIVEPAFVVIGRLPMPEDIAKSTVQVVLADDGFEENAIRQLRRDPNGEEAQLEGFAVFQVPRTQLCAASWNPKSRIARHQITALSERALPTVADLFNIHMGIRTGNMKAFVFRTAQLDDLGIPDRERVWFRPAASNRTIRSGRILSGLHVFYPYTPEGKPAFNDDDALAAAVPRYFETVLKEMQGPLDNRRCKRVWWELSRARTSWQAVPKPKIVSAYFGNRGSFAYDVDGEFTVVQGFGWFMKSATASEIEWAYLAMLNSRYFQSVLAQFCPTVRGGQYDLSNRFVGKAFIPDLANDTRIAGSTTMQLIEYGRTIGTGRFPELDELDRAVCRAFGVSFDEWQEDEDM